MLPSSKAWGAKTRQLLDVKPKTENVLALKSRSGTLIFEPNAKAKLFADNFTAKYTLILREQNHYSENIKNAHVQMIEPMPHEQKQRRYFEA